MAFQDNDSDLIFSGNDNTIGGAGSAGNLILNSGENGIEILGNSQGNVFQDNVVEEGGGDAIHVDSGPNTIIGNVLAAIRLFQSVPPC